jgi:hypothetical protein
MYTGYFHTWRKHAADELGSGGTRPRCCERCCGAELEGAGARAGRVLCGGGRTWAGAWRIRRRGGDVAGGVAGHSRCACGRRAEQLGRGRELRAGGWLVGEGRQGAEQLGRGVGGLG